MGNGEDGQDDNVPVGHMGGLDLALMGSYGAVTTANIAGILVKW